MNRALIIVAHGSSVNPDTALSVAEHASALAARPEISARFNSVRAVFLKQEPRLAELDWPWDEALVVPFFMADGYFVRKVLPRELGVDAWSEYPATRQVGECSVTVVEPLGIRKELVDVVRQIHADVDPTAHLLLVGHGTPEHAESTTSVHDVAKLLAGELPRSVRVGFVDDDPPLSESWSDDVHAGETVVVVPYFAFRGPHVLEDIPELLGLPDASPGPHEVRGRLVRYAEPIGTSDTIVDVLEKLSRSVRQQA